MKLTKIASYNHLGQKELEVVATQVTYIISMMLRIGLLDQVEQQMRNPISRSILLNLKRRRLYGHNKGEYVQLTRAFPQNHLGQNERRILSDRVDFFVVDMFKTVVLDRLGFMIRAPVFRHISREYVKEDL